MIVRGALSSRVVEKLRHDADSLSKVEPPSYENGCVLEPVVEQRGELWRTSAKEYARVRRGDASSSSEIVEALLGPPLAELASQFLCSDVFLFNEHYVVKPPKSPIVFGWHVDGNLQLAAVGGGDDEYVSCWCALDDANEENGCLVTKSAGPLPCRAGDVVLLSSQCEHMSGPNSTDSPRRAFYAQYTRRPVVVGDGGVLRLAIPTLYRSDMGRARSLMDASRWNEAAALWPGARSSFWDLIHDSSSSWRDVPTHYRATYAMASYYHALCLFHADDKNEEIVRILDLGLMIDDGTRRTLLLDLVRRFEENGGDQVTCENISLPPPPPTTTRNCSGTLSMTVLVSPSLETFRTEHFEPSRPVRILDALAWPALQKWTNLGYLKQVAGHRTVPVELGRHYLDDRWTEELMPLSKFIDRHILLKKEDGGATRRRGYLAQHALFDQIPKLRRDISLPDYCALSVADEERTEPRLNAWFGPGDTVSPLHHDRYHNLLCQVFGVKYVRLYSPDQTARLYPRTGDPLHSISSLVVDINHVDDASFPLFKDAPYTDCFLKPGDMLYIPPHTWHYVEACETSFSVSVWWT